jgi:hypothetical protein
VTVGVAAAGVVSSTSADAATGPECFGDTHAAVCVIIDPTGLPTVSPTGGPGVHECIFVGPPPCMPVNVPTPLVAPGSGSYVAVVYCIGDSIVCTPVYVRLPAPLAS